MADTSGAHRPQPSGEGDSPLELLRGWLKSLTRRNGEPGVREALEEMLEGREEDETPIDPQERLLIGNILKLHTLTAADVMVQRVDIIALEFDTPFDEVVRLIAEQGHSRIPVYRETLDDVVGIVHIKDVFPYVADRRPVKLAALVRKVLFVAPSMPVLDLLLQMRLSRTHMAMVVDEFGGIDGLVTIEDLIEEIVGEIEDEHDLADRPTLIERADGSAIADARASIEDVESRYGVALLPEDEEEVDTLGGLVFTLAGRVPARGETIHHPSGIEFEVLDADPRRVKRLRLRNLPAAATSAGERPAPDGTPSLNDR
jgi:CBS domain containing-hemolysin-like protein